MKVSKNYIVPIDEFMVNYLDIIYNYNEKLTHKEMQLFLLEKGKVCPERISTKSIKNEDILTGKYILVKDEVNRIIAYQNPQSLELFRINKLLKSLCHDQEELERRRQKKLSQQINDKSVGEIDYIKYSLKTINRPKKKNRVKRLSRGVNF